MSAGARIVFTRFLSGDSAKLVPWMAHLRGVTGSVRHESADADSLAEGAVVWHLASANNRQLARSVEVHDTFEHASASAREVIAALPKLIVEPVSEAARGAYGWYAGLAEAPLLVCARWYGNTRDRSHSIDLALRSLAVATLHSGARQMHPDLLERRLEISL